MTTESDDDLEEVYSWVDDVPLTRRKRNIVRDFSDCSLIAQIIKYHLPEKHKSLVQVHNYVESSSF